MEIVQAIAISTIYQLILLRFVHHYISEMRSIQMQIIACIVSSFIAQCFTTHFISIGISFIVFILLAFPKKLFFKASVTCLFVAFFVGGMLFVVNENIAISGQRTLILFIATTIIGLYAIFRKGKTLKTETVQRKFVLQVKIELFDIQLMVDGFVDSGNECVEVLSGSPVHFIKYEEIAMYLEASFHSALHQWNAKEPYNVRMFNEIIQTQIRFVSLRTINNPHHIVLAFRGKITVENEPTQSCYFVLIKGREKFPGNAQMLLHASMLAKIHIEGGS